MRASAVSNVSWGGGAMVFAILGFLGGTVRAQCTPLATPLVGVNIPVAKPANAAALSQNLVGFSIESDRWPDWTGIDTPNTYWINTLNNLKAFTGKPPKIRVGANSEDRTTFVASQSVPTIGTFPNWTATTPYPEATSNTIGPSFYTLSKHLPAGTRMTWGLNLGSNNSANAVAEAQNIVSAFAASAVKDKGIVLELIEAGNEPDLFKNNGLRNTSYTVANWQTDWVALTAAVSTALGLKKGSLPEWIAPSLATSDHGAGGFSPQQAFTNGLLSTAPGSLITVIAQHRYSGSFCTGSQGILSDLMSKPYIRGNVTVFKPDSAATRAQRLRYWLGETNSYACHGAPGVSNTAGAALWAIDYALQAATQLIEEVYFHHGIGFKYNFMQPIALDRSITTGEPLSTPTPARVHPSYYGAILISEAIGTAGTTSIVEIATNNAAVVAYAIYDGSKLSRAVLINSQSYTSTSTGVRPTVKVQLLFTAASGVPTSATVKRLKIMRADDTEGLTWGGVSYETASGLPTGTTVTETVNPLEGFLLTATEAVLLKFT